MRPPRLIYYNDAHHYHGKQVDPPVSTHKLRWPVDEVAGTGVEALSFGLGYGDVFFHNSKVGRTILDNKDLVESPIDWRIYAMARDAKARGTDQVREVVGRGRQLGVTVLPSLKMNNGQGPGRLRCGSLKNERGVEVTLREAPSEWAYDYSSVEVREYKLALIREMLDEYDADGIELDFLFFPRYFRDSELERGRTTMTSWVAEVRELANEVGTWKGRNLTVLALVFATEAENRRSGMDVRAWLRDRSVDIIVGELSESLFETWLPDVDWLAEAAGSSGAAAYVRPPLRIFDERSSVPHPEMYRALGRSLRTQGFAGMYLSSLYWPFDRRERDILRDAAYPEVNERLNKRYVLQPRELPAKTDSRGFAPVVPERAVPVVLKEGETATVPIHIADDLEVARQQGELRSPILTLRFANLCIEDDFEIRVNGKTLPREDAEVSQYRGVMVPGWDRLQQFGNPVAATNGFIGHWFRFRLPVDTLLQGENAVQIETRTLEPSARYERSLNGIEVHVRYAEFARPESFDIERVTPISP